MYFLWGEINSTLSLHNLSHVVHSSLHACHVCVFKFFSSLENPPVSEHLISTSSGTLIYLVFILPHCSSSLITNLNFMVCFSSLSNLKIYWILMKLGWYKEETPGDFKVSLVLPSYFKLSYSMIVMYKRDTNFSISQNDDNLRMIIIYKYLTTFSLL